ncbi:hypothetical protein DRP77_07280 [Candidatus Poribacteria bacterium]|nr:MAG: hypothetical protein DRP77_07280 [Candidatus Poribacteria bacterium]
MASLDDVLEHLRSRNDVVGAYLERTPWGMRVVAVAQTEPQCLEKLLASIEGRPAQLEVIGLRELERAAKAAERNAYVPRDLLRLADSEVLFDTMAILAEAKEKLAQLKRRGFRLNESEVRRYRCELALLLKECEEGDELSRAIAISEGAAMVLRCYMDLNGLRWTDLREAVRTVKSRDGRLYELMRRALGKGELSERLEALREAAERVLEKAGGIWSGEEPVAVGRCASCKDSAMCLRSPEDDAERFFKPAM